MRIAIYSFLIVFTGLLWKDCKAQSFIPRDTSFTIAATYIKEKKARPFIRIAEPDSLNPSVNIEKDIVYRTVQNRNLLLDIYYPTDSTQIYPAVLMVHGGGWRSGDKSHNAAMAIELAKNGFVAISAEYRLSLEATYPAAILDLKDAIQWIKREAKKYAINPKQVAIMGCSAGGQLAALIGTTDSNIKAIVNIDGILAFHHPESEEGTMAAQWLNGDYTTNPTAWTEASALTHAGKNTPPILFINSSYPRFHAGQDDVIRILSSYNIYTEVHTMENSPHPFWFFHPWFQPTMDLTVNFLGKVFIK